MAAPEEEYHPGMAYLITSASGLSTGLGVCEFCLLDALLMWPVGPGAMFLPRGLGLASSITSASDLSTGLGVCSYAESACGAMFV